MTLGPDAAWSRFAFAEAYTSSHLRCREEISVVTLRKRLDDVWTLRWAGVVLTVIVTLAAGAFFYRIPPPGVSATVMGVVAAVVSLRTEASGTEKFIWILLIVAFLVIEVEAIKKDRFLNAIDATRRVEEERKYFTGINQDLKSGVEETLNTTTGGDSYCYVEDRNPRFPFLVVCPGKYPIYDLDVLVVDADRQKAGDPKAQLLHQKIGDISANAFRGSGITLPFTETDKQDLNVYFEARNGFWTELLRLRKVKDTWLAAKLVYRFPNSRFPKGGMIYQLVDKDFPIDELKADEDWQMWFRTIHP